MRGGSAGAATRVGAAPLSGLDAENPRKEPPKSFGVGKAENYNNFFFFFSLTLPASPFNFPALFVPLLAGKNKAKQIQQNSLRRI